ncbi:MAG TPA: glycine cleavage system aminomethyltransferase GcvT [Polyangiaceae bacterium]|nr:glycine cleavage system aminomethyltransferase GcvT [Polyangiaceae bacterium]
MIDAPLRRTSLYAEHVALGARFVPFAGWEMPVQYAGVVEEHRAVRGAAGIFDVSHMGELRLRGQYSKLVVDYLVTNDTKRLSDGQALYTCACNEQGMILDDLIVYRRAEDDWLVVCNGSNRAKMSAHFGQAAKDHCDFEDESERTALLALQGPRAFEVLARLGKEGQELSTLKSFHFRDATLAGVDCTVARTGYTGEDGVEIFCEWDDAPQIWRALIASGIPLGLRPAGLGARDTLRLEARLALYGNDIDESTQPFEAGLGWVVRLDKGDFVGKAALERARSLPPTRRLVGFEVVGRGIARHGYPLRDLGGREVGTCTSGSPGPTVGKNIGLGYLPPEMSQIGERFLVDCRGKNVDATVVPTPFYKRSRSGAKP